MLKYQILDWFFMVFHSAIIFFNLFGWILRKTRKWNLALLGTTAFSWFLLGIFHGIGYCFLTDWHWDILRKLGQYPYENSYIQYLMRRVFQLEISAKLADTATGVLFFLALFVSLFFNIRDWKHKSLKSKGIKTKSKRKPC
jgi:hypothetical protein